MNGKKKTEICIYHPYKKVVILLTKARGLLRPCLCLVYDISLNSSHRGYSVKRHTHSTTTEVDILTYLPDNVFRTLRSDRTDNHRSIDPVQILYCLGSICTELFYKTYSALLTYHNDYNQLYATHTVGCVTEWFLFI